MSGQLTFSISGLEHMAEAAIADMVARLERRLSEQVAKPADIKGAWLNTKQAQAYFAGAKILLEIGERTGRLSPMTLAGRLGKMYYLPELEAFSAYLFKKQQEGKLPPDFFTAAKKAAKKSDNGNSREQIVRPQHKSPRGDGRRASDSD